MEKKHRVIEEEEEVACSANGNCTRLMRGKEEENKVGVDRVERVLWRNGGKFGPCLHNAPAASHRLAAGCPEPPITSSCALLASC